jgi:hypothetical protein
LITDGLGKSILHSPSGISDRTIPHCHNAKYTGGLLIGQYVDITRIRQAGEACAVWQ